MFEIVEIQTLTGGTIGMAPQPNSAAEFEILAAYGADHMITLTETHEWQVEDFETYARDSARYWHHHPVRDFTPANADINPLVETLTMVLRDQGKIFIHCRGGCGRTGMLAMRLLILQGEDP
ncbi:MAG: protein-tyrosine phosphatase family protein, partial [Pseudomonadota bacterium]